MNVLGLYIRSVMADWAKSFLLASVALTVIMLLVGVVREARQQDLAPETIMLLLPFLIPEALRFTLPAMALLAGAITFGRMSASGEIIALKAAGVNVITAVFVPMLGLACLLSLASTWINDLAVTWGRMGVERVVIGAIEEVIHDKLAKTGHFATDAFSITVQDVRGKQLVEPTVVFQAGDGRDVTITASEAQLGFDPEAHELSIAIRHGTASGGDVNYVFDHEERRIPFAQLDPNRSPSNIAMGQLAAEMQGCRDALDEYRERLAADLGQSLLTGDHPSLAAELWTGRLDSIRIRYEHIARLKTEPYRRWANGFSALFFMMVGLPLAALNKRGDAMTNFGACFLPIVAIYYPLLVLTVNQAKDGSLPSWSVWAGNALLAIWGGWLMYRVWRY